MWTGCLSFINSRVCLEPRHIALGFYHEDEKTKQAQRLSSPRPGRVDSNIGADRSHLAFPFRCDLNSFAPPVPLDPQSIMSDVIGRHLPFRYLLPTSLAPRQMNSKHAQLQLMGWIGSLSSSWVRENICSHRKHTVPWGLCIGEPRNNYFNRLKSGPLLTPSRPKQGAVTWRSHRV